MTRTPQVEALPGMTPLGISEPIKVDKRDVAQIIRATFPGYLGRKVFVRAKSSISICHSDLNWSGWTRYQYRACTLSGQSTGSLDKHNASAPWEKAPGSTTIPIEPGCCVIDMCCFAARTWA